MLALLDKWYVLTILTLPLQSFTSSVHQCQLLESTVVVSGKYCPVKSGAVIHCHLHHCRAMCLQTGKCAAYNYNNSDNTCIRLIAPCPVAESNAVMEFGILTARTHPECFEWIPVTGSNLHNDRMIAGGHSDRIVARTTDGGANYFGYYHVAHGACFIATSTTNAERINGSPCERLHISESCTVFWAPYTAGDPLPANIVIGGKEADGVNVYIARFNGKSGHYTRGATHGYVPHGDVEVQTSTQMELLVLV